MPQAPQLLMSLVRLVSHPLETEPSQLAKPPLHAIWHAPPEHVGAALAVEQAFPQVPQLSTLAEVPVSQPLAGFPSQLANPALQLESWQVPVEHDAVALFLLHVTPQEPQSVSVRRLVSHPLLGLPSQLA